MKSDAEWVIVDTETDGLYEPIRIVEIAAQRMRGWTPIGAPFRVLLNHNVPISDEAFSIHGYSSEFLAEHGVDPVAAHESFRQYAEDLPVISHNLAFDWNRCLNLEWQRIGVPQIGRRGFCALTLARRIIYESKSHKLEVLKGLFRLTQNESHRALNDVTTVVELFQGEYRRRLEAINITSYDEISALTKMPIARCREMVASALPTIERLPQNDLASSTKKQPASDEPNLTLNHQVSAKRVVIQPLQYTAASIARDKASDAWYYLDKDRKPAGPLSANILRDYVMKSQWPFYVWRSPMKEWQLTDACPDFSACYEASLEVPIPKAKHSPQDHSIDELARACRKIVSTGKITSHEVYFLGDWLSESGLDTKSPGAEIASLIDKILEDGIVTSGEREELSALIRNIFE